MRRMILLHAGFFLILQAVLGQQPSNGGLENWVDSTNYKVPLGFYTSDVIWTFFPLPTPAVSRTSDAHSGLYAALVRTSSIGQLTLGGQLVYGTCRITPSGNYFGGQPFSARPSKLKFWYKFLPSGNDTALAILYLSKGKTGIGIAELYLPFAATSYTQADVSVTYISREIPDSITIGFYSSAPGKTSTVGTVLYVDDITLEYSTGVTNRTDEVDFRFELLQNFPNPFNPTTVISFRITQRDFVTLKIFDLLGREIKTLVSEELQAGRHSVTLDANCLPGSAYFYRLQAGQFVQTKRLVLLR